MLHFFFGFEGRIRRTNYFLGSLATWIVAGAFDAPLFLGAHAWNHGWRWDYYGWPFAPGFWLVATIVGVAALWTTLALAAKRWHDMGAPGWLAILSLIPGAHFIVFLVLCLVPPSRSPNPYGPDPRLTAAVA
jgi:uncharacterized membrane protein YhaH (DUF805 family)